MIGLRFSECVRDIATGHVRQEDVRVIYTATLCRTQFAWKSLVECCRRKCWNGHGDQAEKIALELLASGIIRQPRFTGKRPLVLNNCYWVISEHDIVWEKTKE